MALTIERGPSRRDLELSLIYRRDEANEPPLMFRQAEPSARPHYSRHQVAFWAIDEEGNKREIVGVINCLSSWDDSGTEWDFVLDIATIDGVVIGVSYVMDGAYNVSTRLGEGKLSDANDEDELEVSMTEVADIVIAVRPEIQAALDRGEIQEQAVVAAMFTKDQALVYHPLKREKQTKPSGEPANK